MIAKFLKEQTRKIQIYLTGSEYYWKLSAGGYSLYVPVKRAIEENIKGEVLDLGAGTMPYKKLLKKFATKYYSFDIEQRDKKIDYIGSIDNLRKITKGKKFDSIFCTEVFEHIPEPFISAEEVYQSLKPGGVAIITVPFIMNLHNEPYDFFRYTKYALKYIFKKFDHVEVIPSGGMLSYIHYFLSSIYMPVLFTDKFIFNIALRINFVLAWICYNLDELIGFRMLPYRYIAICYKKG